MNPSNIITRKAVASDTDALVGLLRELFSIEEDFAFNEQSQRRGLAMMIAEHPDRCVMVAETEDGVQGSLAQKKGIGGKRLASVETWANARGLTRLQLLADHNNMQGLEFYKKMNWQTTQLICLRKKDF